jgi:hypothetical protein
MYGHVITSVQYVSADDALGFEGDSHALHALGDAQHPAGQILTPGETSRTDLLTCKNRRRGAFALELVQIGDGVRNHKIGRHLLDLHGASREQAVELGARGNVLGHHDYADGVRGGLGVLLKSSCVQEHRQCRRRCEHHGDRDNGYS